MIHQKKRIEVGFNINQEIEDLHNLFSELDQEDMSVFKARGDYEIRVGLTVKHIPTNENKSVQILHVLLRTFDFIIMKVIAHTMGAGIYDWLVRIES